jgi:antitoxin Phd_YefM of type II toxin-antitoxin system
VASVGVRELKNRLSEFLRRAAEGERITVTDRGQPLAVISRPETTADDDTVTTMVREGVASWSGGKPRGAARPIRVRGVPVARTVIEERR